MKKKLLALTAALLIVFTQGAFAQDTLWKALCAENITVAAVEGEALFAADDSGARAAEDAALCLCFTAEAGEALAFEYLAPADAREGVLTVTLNGAEKTLVGCGEWAQARLTLAETGEQEAIVRWRRGEGGAGEAALRGASVGQTAQAAGEATYRVVVTDSAGKAVPGAMLQMCDDATCLVLTTDETGAAAHTGAPYPYEIHVLRAPQGYAKPAATLLMPVGGGEAVIVLESEAGEGK